MKEKFDYMFTKAYECTMFTKACMSLTLNRKCFWMRNLVRGPHPSR